MAIDKTKGDDEPSKERIIVVPELPTQPTNKAVTEEGEHLSLLTISEALTEIYNDIKSIKKAVV